MKRPVYIVNPVTGTAHRLDVNESDEPFVPVTSDEWPLPVIAATNSALPRAFASKDHASLSARAAQNALRVKCPPPSRPVPIPRPKQTRHVTDMSRDELGPMPVLVCGDSDNDEDDAFAGEL